MMPTAFVVAPSDRPPPLNVLGVSVTVLATSGQTKGYEITLQSADSGMGPPPHSHGWDESFFVLEGSVDMVVAGRAVNCKSGTLVHVPAGTVHSFRFGPDGARLLEITGAGGLAAQMFGHVSREIPPGPLDLDKVTAVLAENGVTLA